jgi:hypothetical protein
MRLNLLFSILIVFLSIPIGLSEETPFDIMNTAFYAMNVSPTSVSPGENSVLNVTLKHLGTQFASRIEASLDPFDISGL